MAVATATDDLLLANLDGELSPEAAASVLTLKFSQEQRDRMDALAAMARDGSLDEAERFEAESFERVSSLLGILKSRARMALRDAS